MTECDVIYALWVSHSSKRTSASSSPPGGGEEEGAEGGGAFVGHLSIFWKSCKCPTVGPGGSYINQEQHVFANRNE